MSAFSLSNQSPDKVRALAQEIADAPDDAHREIIIQREIKKYENDVEENERDHSGKFSTIFILLMLLLLLPLIGGLLYWLGPKLFDLLKLLLGLSIVRSLLNALKELLRRGGEGGTPFISGGLEAEVLEEVEANLETTPQVVPLPESPIFEPVPMPEGFEPVPNVSYPPEWNLSPEMNFAPTYEAIPGQNFSPAPEGWEQLFSEIPAEATSPMAQFNPTSIEMLDQGLTTEVAIPEGNLGLAESPVEVTTEVPEEAVQTFQELFPNVQFFEVTAETSFAELIDARSDGLIINFAEITPQTNPELSNLLNVLREQQPQLYETLLNPETQLARANVHEILDIYYGIDPEGAQEAVRTLSQEGVLDSQFPHDFSFYESGNVTTIVAAPEPGTTYMRVYHDGGWLNLEVIPQANGEQTVRVGTWYVYNNPGVINPPYNMSAEELGQLSTVIGVTIVTAPLVVGTVLYAGPAVVAAAPTLPAWAPQLGGLTLSGVTAAASSGVFLPGNVMEHALPEATELTTEVEPEIEVLTESANEATQEAEAAITEVTSPEVTVETITFTPTEVDRQLISNIDLSQAITPEEINELTIEELLTERPVFTPESLNFSQNYLVQDYLNSVRMYDEGLYLKIIYGIELTPQEVEQSLNIFYTRELIDTGNGALAENIILGLQEEGLVGLEFRPVMIPTVFFEIPSSELANMTITDFIVARSWGRYIPEGFENVNPLLTNLNANLDSIPNIYLPNQFNPEEIAHAQELLLSSEPLTKDQTIELMNLFGNFEETRPIAEEISTFLNVDISSYAIARPIHLAEFQTMSVADYIYQSRIRPLAPDILQNLSSNSAVVPFFNTEGNLVINNEVITSSTPLETIIESLYADPNTRNIAIELANDSGNASLLPTLQLEYEQEAVIQSSVAPTETPETEPVVTSSPIAPVGTPMPSQSGLITTFGNSGGTTTLTITSGSGIIGVYPGASATFPVDESIITQIAQLSPSGWNPELSNMYVIANTSGNGFSLQAASFETATHSISYQGGILTFTPVAR